MLATASTIRPALARVGQSNRLYSTVCLRVHSRSSCMGVGQGWERGGAGWKQGRVGVGMRQDGYTLGFGKKYAKRILDCSQLPQL